MSDTPVFEVHNPGYEDDLGMFYQEHLGYVSADNQNDALDQAQVEYNPDVEVSISYYHSDYEE